MLWFLFFCAVVIAMMLLSLLTPLVADCSSMSRDDREWLARAAVAEAGWDAETDHAAIVHLLIRRAHIIGVTPARMARMYSRPLQRAHARARWVRALKYRSADEPTGWPSTAAWAPTHRDAWMRVCAIVDGVADGGTQDPCPGARHFGRPGDPLADRPRARCSGPTVSIFVR